MVRNRNADLHSDGVQFMYYERQAACTCALGFFTIHHPNHPLMVSPAVALPSALRFLRNSFISATCRPVSLAAVPSMITLCSSTSLSAGVISFILSRSALCEAAVKSFCVSEERMGRSGFESLGSVDLAGTEVGEGETSAAVAAAAEDDSIDGKEGIGEFDAFASSTAFSCASMRW